MANRLKDGDELVAPDCSGIENRSAAVIFRLPSLLHTVPCSGPRAASNLQLIRCGIGLAQRRTVRPSWRGTPQTNHADAGGSAATSAWILRICSTSSGLRARAKPHSVATPN